MMSHVLHMTEPSLELLATWGNTRETPKVLACSSPLNLITLHTLFKISCQDFCL